MGAAALYPICRKAVAGDAPHQPFCCERCKLVDLGRWFRGDYAVPGEDAADFDEIARAAGEDPADRE